MKKKWIIEVIALLIILLFLYTGISKLWDFAVFRAQLRESPWTLLAGLSNVVAWTLPLGELLLVGLLIWPATRKTGFILSALLFGVFIVYLVILLSSGKRLPCSCGGIISTMSWETHVYFNTLFLLLSLTGVYLERKSGRKRAITERATSLP